MRETRDFKRGLYFRFMLQLQWWENPSSNYSESALYNIFYDGFESKNLQIRGRKNYFHVTFQKKNFTF